MNDNDLIRRGDALKALDWGDIYGRNAQDAINAIPAVQPTVKPLVWGEFKADGVFAERIWASEIYTIEKRNHAEVFDLYCNLWDGDNSVRFPTLEAAKAAAQTDYEARILSALDMQPTVSPDVAALVEALRSTLNFIENTEGEMGVILGCGDKARAALARVKGVM